MAQSLGDRRRHRLDVLEPLDQRDAHHPHTEPLQQFHGLVGAPAIGEDHPDAERQVGLGTRPDLPEGTRLAGQQRQPGVGGLRRRGSDLAGIGKHQKILVAVHGGRRRPRTGGNGNPNRGGRAQKAGRCQAEGQPPHRNPLPLRSSGSGISPR